MVKKDKSHASKGREGFASHEWQKTHIQSPSMGPFKHRQDLGQLLKFLNH